MKPLTTLLLLVVLTVPALGQGQAKFLGKSASAWQQELKAKSAPAQRDAAFALGKLGTSAEAAVDDLIALLKERGTDRSVREAAAFSLGEICKDSLRASGNRALLPTLEAALKSDLDPLVRRSAAYALGCMQGDAGTAIKTLDAALKDTSPAVRQNVAWALGRVGEEAVDSLRKALRDTDARVRRDAANSVMQLKGKGRPALHELLACCTFPDVEVKKSALGALVPLVTPKDATVAAGPLQQALKDGDRDVRFNSALALAAIGGKDATDAVPVLVDVLKGGSNDQRRTAAVAVGNIGPPASPAVPSLRRALKDADDQLRENAAGALGGIGPGAEEAVPDLMDMVANQAEKTEARANAATALQAIGSNDTSVKTIPQLIDVLGDSRGPSKVRERTMWALRAHNKKLENYPTLFPKMTEILDEPKDKIGKMLRYDCAFMLGVFKKEQAPKQALVGLSDFLADPTILVYKGAIRKLVGDFEGSSSSGGTEEQGEGDGRVMAVLAIRAIGAARVRADRPLIIEQMRALAKNPETDPDLRKEIQKALNAFGN